MNRPTVKLFLSFFILGATAWSQEPVPVGTEFLVNTYTTDKQSSPSVAVETNGDFVVVWESVGSGGTDSDSSSMQGQRFDAVGMPVGGEFQVNTYTTSSQFFASVGVAPDGDFVVVWISDGSSDTDTSDFSIQGQRFDATGAALGAQFQINTYTSFRQTLPKVAVDPEGDFVVVRESVGSGESDTDGYSVQGQRFNAAGAALGAQFQVNTNTTSDQRAPMVAVDNKGDFVVVWESSRSSGTDNSLKSVQGQRYDAAGGRRREFSDQYLRDEPSAFPFGGGRVRR